MLDGSRTYPVPQIFQARSLIPSLTADPCSPPALGVPPSLGLLLSPLTCILSILARNSSSSKAALNNCFIPALIWLLQNSSFATGLERGISFLEIFCFYSISSPFPMIPHPLPCPDRFLHAELFPDGRFGADSNLHNLNLLPGMNYSTTQHRL